MALNDPVVLPKSREPRALIKLNGIEAPGLVSFQLDSNNYYRANTFHAEFALKHPGDQTINWAWWAEQEQIRVEIYAGFPADPTAYSTADLEKIFVGEVDELVTSPVTNRVDIDGRDLSLRFIEHKTTEKYPNMTSSEIIKKLAQDQGVEAVVTDTSTKTGAYYNAEDTQLQDERTVWDLMCFLAQQEEFILFMKSDVLHFQPAPTEDSDPYVLQWQDPDNNVPTPVANYIDIKFKRSLTIAKDVIVLLRSWNSKQKKGFTTTAKAAKANRRQTGGGDAQTYSYVVPGLTKEKALKRAQSILMDISKHEIKVDLRLPADTTVDESTVLKVQGTGTVFDQVYFADHVVRHFSIREGYAMEIRAKNHSPISTVLS